MSVPPGGADKEPPVSHVGDRQPPRTPQGEGIVWSATGSLLAGPIVWGGVGLLLDRWLGTRPVLTIVGLLVGCLTAFLIVYVRFGRDEEPHG